MNRIRTLRKIGSTSQKRISERNRSATVFSELLGKRKENSING